MNQNTFLNVTKHELNNIFLIFSHLLVSLFANRALAEVAAVELPTYYTAVIFLLPVYATQHGHKIRKYEY